VYLAGDERILGNPGIRPSLAKEISNFLLYHSYTTYAAEFRRQHVWRLALLDHFGELAQVAVDGWGDDVLQGEQASVAVHGQV
jgi:hypothetical protein